MKRAMSSEDAVDLYGALEARGMRIWIDGGWAVDALLGEQTRPHEDLDIAVERKDLVGLKEYLESLGYRDKARDPEKMWDLVLGDDHGHEVEVHAFDLDDEGEIIEESYWDGYSRDSLSGLGSIDGKIVRCVSLKQLMKTHDETKRIFKRSDYDDVTSLQKKFDLM